MRWDYPPLDINPLFPGLGKFFIIIIFIIIITIIIIIIVIIIIFIINKSKRRILYKNYLHSKVQPF